jgi:zinc D-Ala-D-Ala carboxypeptidase
MLVPEYFVDGELCCHCGCGLLPPQRSVERLYALRLAIHKPLAITSGARCRKRNRAVGGKQGSVHLAEDVRRGVSKDWGGGAFDILADDVLKVEIIAAARPLGFMGFGIAKNYIHIDDARRPCVAVWRYDA